MRSPSRYAGTERALPNAAAAARFAAKAGVMGRGAFIDIHQSQMLTFANFVTWRVKHLNKPQSSPLRMMKSTACSSTND
jgi:hypothetical protein